MPDKGILTNDVNIDMLQKYPDIRKKTRIEDFKKFFARKKSGSTHFRVDGKDIVIFRLKSTSGSYHYY
jgi:ribosomal protein L1